MAFINNLAYEASAGSGKTFMLVVRYLSLLFKGADPAKILALTFTNKAANEMQERIVITLEELERRGELDEIIKVCGLPKEYILQNRYKVLKQFLSANTKIMTIDSFFTLILRKFSLYASLMPDFSTFSSQHELKLLSRFLKEVDVARKTETLIGLSLHSKKRLTDIFTLLNEFYEKKHELRSLKFSKQELWRHEKEAFDALEELASLVNNCKGASTTVKNAVVAESFEDLAKKTWLERDSLDYRTFSKCYTPDMDALLHRIKNALFSYNRAKEQNFFHALSELVGIYEKSKKALYIDDSELSFSDVTVLVHYLLKERVDSDFLYFRLDSQIEHMLLDEFQDTSILQYEILKPLIDEIVSGEGIFNDGSFFFVGDVKQSIYRFRGGVSELFNAVKDECGTQTDQLLTNYRSQKEVIEFVNKAFISKIKNYSAQLVRADAQGGYVEVIVDDEIIQKSIEQVEKLLNLGADINEIAILCATNGDGESIKEALEAKGLAVVTETTTKLINQKSIKALLEYLKYLYFGESIYKYNFFALIEQEPRSIKFIDLSSIKLVDIVKSAIDEYKLFGDDFHLLRFLSSISKYPDIEALLFEYERLDTSAATSDLNGVRVLTVHKSKGLEYEHVIVMDRLKNPPPAKNSIIYEYDGISLQNVYLRTSGREHLDSAYAYALEKEKALVIEDTLNALYVAFTRAKENLFVIAKSKKSMFDILDLQTGSSGVLTCSTTKTKKQEQNYEKLRYKAMYYGTQSDLLSLENTSNEDLNAINFGLAMHYMLEMMSEFKKESIQNAHNMMLNKYGYLLSDEEIQEIDKRVETLINSQEFLALSDGVCYKEKALRHKKNLRYIDLLVKHKNGVWNVIDYKSSMSFADEHHKQVKYYVDAIKEITGDSVDGYICYLLESGAKIVKV